MTTKFQLHEQLFTAALPKRMLAGAARSFVLITIFLMGVNNPDPEWPQYWKARPMLIVPIAGAIGGAFYDFMNILRHQGGIRKIAGIAIGVLGLIVILWLGTVLGLDGTLWN